MLQKIILPFLFRHPKASITFLLVSMLVQPYPGELLAASFLIILGLSRGAASFFIIRLTLRASHGIIVNNYGLPTIFRSYAFFLLCFLIVGIASCFGWLIPSFLIYSTIEEGSSTFNLQYYTFAKIAVITLIFVVDTGGMLVLTWVVWKRYMKHKVKKSQSFFFKMQS